MTIETLADIPDGMANWTISPKIQAMMTGVDMVKQDNTGNVKLVYADGTEELARLDYDIRQEESFFKIVGDVQDKAKRSRNNAPTA